MRRLILTILATMFLVSTGYAQPSGEGPAAMDPKTLLKSKIDEVLGVLESNHADTKKRNQIEQIVDPVFNYELMAKLSVGPENWPKMNEAQRKEFTGLFVKRLKDSYFDKISLYQSNTNAQVTYKDAVNEGNKIRIPVVVAAKDGSVNMGYKFFQSGTGWQVYDVEINGVSIVQSYRSQFNQVLAGGTVEDLINELKKPAKPKKTP